MIRYALIIGLGLSLSACTSMGFNGPNQPTTLDLLKEINQHCSFDGQMGAGVGGFAGTGTGASLSGSMHCKPADAAVPGGGTFGGAGATGVQPGTAPETHAQ